jgi:hypothetical protein
MATTYGRIAHRTIDPSRSAAARTATINRRAERAAAAERRATAAEVAEVQAAAWSVAR